MILFLLLAAGAYVLYRRADPNDLGPGLQELGLAEDGSFVLVATSPPHQTSVGHAPITDCFGTGSHRSGKTAVGCAPGRDCCADCRSGEVEVGHLGPGQSAVSVGQVHQLVAVLAQRIAGGDPDAIRRAEAIFSLALEKGDLRARFVAEEITRAMDHYTPGSGVAQYAVHGL